MNDKNNRFITISNFSGSSDDGDSNSNVHVMNVEKKKKEGEGGGDWSIVNVDRIIYQLALSSYFNLDRYETVIHPQAMSFEPGCILSGWSGRLGE